VLHHLEKRFSEISWSDLGHSLQKGSVVGTEFHVTQNYGHPWTGKGNWDLMEIKAGSEAELNEFVMKAEQKFWQCWIKGEGEAVMYKPTGAKEPWEDNPERPQPTVPSPTNESP
jgi:hypothetical protein